MSRKMGPPATSRSNLNRQPSNNTISHSSSRDMPPPSRVPSSRPTSALSASTASAKQASNGHDSHDESGKGAGVRGKNGAAKLGADVDENGEINIQVVVRCRGRS